jgi:RNA ligase (TIGR02306 family)
MSSPLVIPVATIRSVAPHPNADSLDICQVLGWQCVVGRNQFEEGQRIIYFPADTQLTPEFSDSLGVTQYLHRGRIKPTRLRGEPSFGLVVRCENDEWQVGDNVAEHFPGASKWEPPTREERNPGQGKFIPNPNAVPRNPNFPEYTGINNLRHYPDLFGSDELVVVTEKLHGTNSRIGMIDGEWVAGSHRVQRGESDEVYWSPRKHAEKLVEALGKYHRQVVLYGEIVGSDVQSLDYGYKGYEGYYAFDLMIDGRYVDYNAFSMTCYAYKVPVVPVLAYYVCYDFDDIRRWAQGATEIIGVEHIREGVVVKPVIERHDPRVGRAIAKFVSDDYLLAKRSDFTEV